MALYGAGSMALVSTASVARLLSANRLKEKDVTGLTITVDGEEKAILLTKQGGKPVKERRHKKHWWPESKKIEAATLYAATGSIPRTSSLAKVPLQTLRNWISEDWFLQIMNRVKREEGVAMDRKFTKIVDKALDKIEERIDTGDYVYDMKRGVAAPIPMSGRDLTLVTGTLFDKRQLIRGDATKITTAVNSEEHLKKLAQDFIKFVADKRLAKREIVIEGEVYDSEEDSGWLSSGKQTGKEPGKEQKQEGSGQEAPTGGVVQKA